MDLVVDANVLFSALIKNSLTIELLFEEELNLFAPEFILEEFEKYEELLLKKTHRTKEEFNEILQTVKELITIIPKEEYSKFLENAKKLSPDTKDVLYFALALKLKCGIWSNDKPLKEEQSKVAVYNTGDVLKLVK